MKLDQPYMVLDLETSDINPFTCQVDRIGFLFLWEREYTWEYYEVNYREKIRKLLYTDHANRLFRDILRNPEVPIVGHNLAFDLQVLHRKDFEIAGPLHDTMLLMKCLKTNLNSYGLKPLNYMLFGDPCLDDMRLETWFKSHSFALDNRDMTQPPNSLVREYCRADVLMTNRLFQYAYPQLGDQKFLYDLEMETLQALLKVERRKIYVDRRYCKAASGYRRRKGETIKETLEFNPRSTVQLGKRLAENGVRVERTSKGNIRTDEKHLQQYKREHSSELIEDVFRIRKLSKDRETYLKNFLDATTDQNPYFHPHFNQSLAVTRRFSSSGYFGEEGQITRGNMQNIPVALRRAIIPPKGYLVAAIDMSQIEPRMLASLIEQRLDYHAFADRYRRDPKYNIYLDVAQKAGRRSIKKGSKLYDLFKATVLALAYGSGPLRTSEQLGIPLRRAILIRAKVIAVYPQIKRIQEVMTALAEDNAGIIDDFNARYQMEKHEAYTAVNKFCQGCSGNVFKWWLTEYDRYVEETRSPDLLWNLLHDEIDLYILDDGKQEKRLQAYCALLKKLKKVFKIPITAEYKIGKHWGECK